VAGLAAPHRSASAGHHWTAPEVTPLSIRTRAGGVFCDILRGSDRTATDTALHSSFPQARADQSMFPPPIDCQASALRFSICNNIAP
jgi:hypothetical protein